MDPTLVAVLGLYVVIAIYLAGFVWNQHWRPNVNLPTSPNTRVETELRPPPSPPRDVVVDHRHLGSKVSSEENKNGRRDLYRCIRCSLMWAVEEDHGQQETTQDTISDGRFPEIIGCDN